MSMRLPLPPENAPVSVYTVAAPFRSDMLSATLRSAYAGGVEERDPFADLLHALDRIEFVPRAR